jgi:hypothetical protein
VITVKPRYKDTLYKDNRYYTKRANLGRERNRERGRGFLHLRGMGEVLGAVGKKKREQGNAEGRSRKKGKY